MDPAKNWRADASTDIDYLFYHVRLIASVCECGTVKHGDSAVDYYSPVFKGGIDATPTLQGCNYDRLDHNQTIYYCIAPLTLGVAYQIKIRNSVTHITFLPQTRDRSTTFIIAIEP